MTRPWDKLIVALDVSRPLQAKAVIDALCPKVKKFKVGPVAYFQYGPRLLGWLKQAKAGVFLDFKLYDIPNTMAETAKNFVAIGAWAFTVHIKAGPQALIAVRDEVAKTAKSLSVARPLIVGITELTSSQASLGQVLALAGQAAAAGLDGVVASGQEAKAIKEKFGKTLLVITPGIRNPKDQAGDQKRITTAQTAFLNGADYIVVGRPIIAQSDYLKAAEEVLSL